MSPDEYKTHYNLALTLLNQGRYQEAAQQFREAIRLRPDFAEARRKLKITLMRAGRQAE